jgi:flagellar basal-body rod protein FlgC
MSSLPIFDVAGSALSAQSVRLNTIASNLANVDTVGRTRPSRWRHWRARPG